MFQQFSAGATTADATLPGAASGDVARIDAKGAGATGAGVDLADMQDGMACQDFSDEASPRELCDALLESFVAMASRSKRRQADLSAVLKRSGIRATQAQVREAMQQLQVEGCIREIVPLYDGGTLVTVTNLGMDRPGRHAHWAFLKKLSPL